MDIAFTFPTRNTLGDDENATDALDDLCRAISEAYEDFVNAVTSVEAIHAGVRFHRPIRRNVGTKGFFDVAVASGIHVSLHGTDVDCVIVVPVDVDEVRTLLLKRGYDLNQRETLPEAYWNIANRLTSSLVLAEHRRQEAGDADVAQAARLLKVWKKIVEQRIEDGDSIMRCGPERWVHCYAPWKPDT